MPLLLHQTCGRHEALSLLGKGRSREYFNTQVVMAANSIIGLFALEGASRFTTPSQFSWCPPMTKPDVKMTCSEEHLSPGEIFEKISGRNFHHFARVGLDEYLYAGLSFLGAYNKDGSNARFDLKEKLSREAWLRCGGYEGWEVELNHETHHVQEHDDKSLDRLLAQLAGRELSHLSLTRYEEDSLSIFLNERRGWLMYLRTPSDSGLYVKSTDVLVDPNKSEIFECDCGIDLEMSAESTMSKMEAIGIVRDFFQSGTLPTCVEWSDR